MLRYSSISSTFRKLQRGMKCIRLHTNDAINHHHHHSTKPKVSYLDLQNSGLSAIERLCLEEALLRHDPLNRSWAIVGTHEPTEQMHLHNEDGKIRDNNSCLIILGIGGKPELLLDVDKVKKDNVLTVKRFSGGGTVVIDRNSLWTTFIGRTEDFPNVDPYPRSIMSWSANEIFDKVFQNMKYDTIHKSGKVLKKTMVVDAKSCGTAQDSGKTITYIANDDSLAGVDIPDFRLEENDYILGDRKMGGNAQAIVKGGWLHHTSFLFDYEDENMGYLTLPNKRPEYRGDRSHDDFLVKLKSVYGSDPDDDSAKRAFFYHVKCTAFDSFEMEEVLLKDAMKVVDNLGGMQAWFDGKCRTKVVDFE